MINVELITPEKLAFSENVESLVAPSELGELGILPGHAPLLARLAAGELRLKTGGVTRRVAISGGFLEVQHGNRVSVFAETAEFAEEIDVERAKQAAERAQAKLGGTDDLTAAEMAELEAAVSRAALRLKIAGVRWVRRPRSLN